MLSEWSKTELASYFFVFTSDWFGFITDIVEVTF